MALKKLIIDYDVIQMSILCFVFHDFYIFCSPKFLHDKFVHTDSVTVV